jgi:hypothetical protein
MRYGLCLEIRRSFIPLDFGQICRQLDSQISLELFMHLKLVIGEGDQLEREEKEKILCVGKRMTWVFD